MLSFDPTTTAALASATSKLDWCNIIKTNLGNPRILVCKRAASGDPWTDGTIFRDLDLTGEISTTGAVLSEFGASSNARVKTAVDLATGVAVYRVSNAAGTRWVQGTLGLVGSGADCERSANPGTNTGDDFTNIVITPPPLLASGTGPASPAWTSNTPKFLQLVDEDDELVGEFDLDTRKLDLVFQTPLVAEEIGDVQVWQSSDTVTHGTIKFFAKMVRAGGHLTVSGQPHERVHVYMHPTDWAGYPFAENYNQNTHTMYAPPFKILILNDARQPIVNTQGHSAIEMHDGLHVNDKTLPQDEMWDNVDGGPAPPAGDRWADGAVAVRPHVNAAMVLQWVNEHPKLHSKLHTHLNNGLTEDSLRPSQSKSQSSVNGLWYLPGTSNSQTNSISNLWAMKEWPGTKSLNVRMSPIDPWLADPNTGTAAYWAFADGFGNEPGAKGGQDWFTAPGGTRFDRSYLPSVWLMTFSDPTGYRLEGEVPWLKMFHAWNDNMYNHSRHRTGPDGMPVMTKANSLAGYYVAKAGYYGPSNVSDPTKVIETFNIGNAGSKSGKYDYTGRLPVSGYNWETNLHGYGSPGKAVLFANSPGHALLQRYAFDEWSLGLIGERLPTCNPRLYYGQRRHAWRWANMLDTWICGAVHEETYSQGEIEGRFQIELETIHDQIWIPLNNGEQSFFINGLRNLGRPMSVNRTTNASPDNRRYFITGQGDSGGLWLYIGDVVKYMKITGLWGILRAKSVKCQRVLDMVIEHLDKCTLDYIIATRGRFEVSDPAVSDYRLTDTFTVSDVPATWAAVDAIRPSDGRVDWNRMENGDRVTSYDFFGEPGVKYYEVAADHGVQHLQAQWAQTHKQFFMDDYPNPNVDIGLEVYNELNADRLVIRNTGVDFTNQRFRDYTYRVPSHGMAEPLMGIEE